jgi:arylsulfatase A-like enzyme
VILVTIESLRADHVGAYGYAAARTPVLDAIGAKGVRFEQAIAQSCFTAPSMATIATGLYPMEHGVLQWGDRGDGLRLLNLAEVLASHGFRTAFFSGHGALAGISALARGFDTLEDEPDLSAEAIIERVLEWLSAGTAPAFAWLHLFEPHWPYRPGESHGRPRVPLALQERFASRPFAEWERLATTPGSSDFATRTAFLVSQYDAEIELVDEALGSLTKGLRSANRIDRTHLVVTSDHGENLGDHAPFFEHRDYLYDSLIRVPLVWSGPGIGAGVVPVQVGHVDLAPTLLEALGAPSAVPGRSGRSFLRLLRGEMDEERDAFADSGRQSIPHQGVRTGGLKLTRRLADGREILFDLAADPAELRDASRDRPEDAERLRALLDGWLRSLNAAAPGERRFDPEHLERLRALGYVR